MTGQLPPLRRPGSPYRLAVVCLGNICRSPMAHVVLDARLAESGLASRVEVVSAGTGGWHLGDPMDPRAAATLRAEGYDGSRHRVRQFATDWFADLDMVLAMDADNLTDLLAMAPDPAARERVLRFREFDPEPRGLDVPDPYYGGASGFSEVLAIVERTSALLVEALAGTLADTVDRTLADAADRTLDGTLDRTLDGAG